MITREERESLENQRKFETQARQSQEELRGIHAGMLLPKRQSNTFNSCKRTFRRNNFN